jgi:hypothetical protein
VRLFNAIESPSDGLSNDNGVPRVYGWALWWAVDCRYPDGARRYRGNSFPAAPVDVNDLLSPTQVGGLRVGGNPLDAVVILPLVFNPLRV